MAPPTDEAARRSGLRSYAGSLIALLVGAAAILVSFGLTWAVVVVPVFAGPVHGTMNTEQTLTGRDLAPLGAASGWLALAGVAGLLATRSWGRRLVGALVALAGAAAGVISLTFGLTRTAFIDAALAARGAEAPTSVTPTLWWILGAIGGLAVLVAGGTAVALGPSWPRFSRRYERDSGDSRARPDAPVGGLAAWDALDRGEDPTDPGSAAGERPSAG